MIKKIQIFNDLPIEEGKTYRTRFATGELFFVKKIIKVKEKVIRFDGIYWNHKDLGVCPLNVDRLIPEKVLIGEKIISLDSEFDLTDLLKRAFEAGQLDKGNNWYNGDFNEWYRTLKL